MQIFRNMDTKKPAEVTFGAQVYGIAIQPYHGDGMNEQGLTEIS
jgi:hypothetical protein